MRGATRALEPRKCRLCRCDRPGARASKVGGASPSTSGGFCANPHSTRTAECEVARLSFSRWPVEREVQKIVIVCSDGAQGKRDNVFWDELGQVATVSTSAPRRMISKAVPALYESWGYEIKILDIVPLSCLEACGASVVIHKDGVFGSGANRSRYGLGKA